VEKSEKRGESGKREGAGKCRSIIKCFDMKEKQSAKWKCWNLVN